MNQPVPQTELFMRDDLIELDLEQPFTAKLAEELRQAGIAIPLRYFTEEELEETLWEFISKSKLYLSSWHTF